MRGTIRTKERRPVCNGAYVPTGTDLECPKHHTRSRRYLVDTSGFGIPTRKLYRDRDGNILESYERANRLLTAMRTAKDSRAGFDPDDWEPKRRKEFQFEIEWEKWFRRGEWAYATAKQIRSIYKVHLSIRFAGMDVRDIRRGHIEDFKEDLRQKGYAAVSVKTKIQWLMAFLSAMKERGDIKEIPSKPKIKVPVRDVRVLSVEEQNQIIGRLAAHHRIVFETLAALGCRPGEVWALKKRDLVGGRVYIQRAYDNAAHLKETKSNRIQCKMLSPELNARLAALCRDRLPEAFIFSGRSGAPYRPVYLSNLWRAAARDAGIPVPLYVGTRHSFATRRWEEIQRDAADKLAREMGHGNADMTFAHYVRTVPNLSPTEDRPS